MHDVSLAGDPASERQIRPLDSVRDILPRLRSTSEIWYAIVPKTKATLLEAALQGTVHCPPLPEGVPPRLW